MTEWEQKKKELEELLMKAKLEVTMLEVLLEQHDGVIENNTFTSLEEAQDSLCDRFWCIAHESCGSYQWGDDVYIQEFLVGDKKYVGTVQIEYNRHDKQWYYVEETRWSYKELE